MSHGERYRAYDLPKRPIVPRTESRYFPSLESRARAKRAAREGNSLAHLALIRKLGCSVCHKRADHAHHLRSGAASKERGIGQKATDRWVVGLCWLHHDEIHRIGSRLEPDWFAEFGINAHALATALWVNTGDLARMGRVLLAHKLSASRDLLQRRGQ